MIDHPALVVFTPTDDHNLKPIPLHVNADGEHQHLMRDGVRPVRFAAGDKASAFELGGRLLPRLAEHGIDPYLQQTRIVPRFQELTYNFRKGEPWREERRDVESGSAPARALSRSSKNPSVARR
jgi:hypothetical protein